MAAPCDWQSECDTSACEDEISTGASLRVSLRCPDYGFDSKLAIRRADTSARFAACRGVRGAYTDWSRDANHWMISDDVVIIIIIIITCAISLHPRRCLRETKHALRVWAYKWHAACLQFHGRKWMMGLFRFTNTASRLTILEPWVFSPVKIGTAEMKADSFTRRRSGLKGHLSTWIGEEGCSHRAVIYPYNMGYGSLEHILLWYRCMHIFF